MTDQILPDGEYRINSSRNYFIKRQYGYIYHMRHKDNYSDAKMQYPYWKIDSGLPVPSTSFGLGKAVKNSSQLNVSVDPVEVELRITEGNKLRIIHNGENCYQYSQHVYGGVYVANTTCTREENGYSSGALFNYERVGDLVDVDCVGEWIDIDYCDRLCGDGEKTQEYIVSTQQLGNGASCPHEHRATQKVACNNQCQPNGIFDENELYELTTYNERSSYIKGLVSDNDNLKYEDRTIGDTVSQSDARFGFVHKGNDVYNMYEKSPSGSLHKCGTETNNIRAKPSKPIRCRNMPHNVVYPDHLDYYRANHSTANPDYTIGAYGDNITLNNCKYGSSDPGVECNSPINPQFQNDVPISEPESVFTVRKENDCRTRAGPCAPSPSSSSPQITYYKKDNERCERGQTKWTVVEGQFEEGAQPAGYSTARPLCEGVGTCFFEKVTAPYNGNECSLRTYCGYPCVD